MGKFCRIDDDIVSYAVSIFPLCYRSESRWPWGNNQVPIPNSKNDSLGLDVFD